MSKIFDTISFTVTDQHLKLLKRFNIGFEHDMEFGAPCVDPKRPYGNSNVYRDMATILGIPPDAGTDDDPIWTSENEDKMRDLHEQMETVLQILCRCLSIKAGRYEAEQYRNDWHLERP